MQPLSLFYGAIEEVSFVRNIDSIGEELNFPYAHSELVWIYVVVETVYAVSHYYWEESAA